MQAVVMEGFGGPNVLKIGEASEPEMNDTEIKVRVKATALNRADLLQRRGRYAPPKGASPLLGLEIAGEVSAVGTLVKEWKIGDRICALLPGGGYAQTVVLPAGMAMPLPQNLSFEEGAAIPEVFLTAYMNLFWLGQLTANMTVLVHAGASGVGTAAIQLIREAGARSIVTAGSSEKIDRCLKLGAEAGWNYHDGSFADWVLERTDDEGVQIIFDFIGAPYFQDNIHSLAIDGKLIIIGTMGGVKLEKFNLSPILGKRLQIIGTLLRSQTADKKIKLTEEFRNFAIPRFSDGRMTPIIDTIYDWKDAAKAHEYMESNQNIGKIILKVN